MLVFDELKKNDPQLRLVAAVLAVGLFILVAGLWWVQVVSSREYQNHLETQAYRSVRIPAVRGKILDREGRVLAENQPSYNLSLFLGDLQKKFSDAYNQLHKQANVAQKQAIAAREKQLGHSLSKAERKQFAFTTVQLEQLRAQARFAVANNIVTQLSRKLQQPVTLDQKSFERACMDSPYVPYPIVKNASATDIARFEENFSGRPGEDLELQSARVYPFGDTAGHLLGYVSEDDRSLKGEEAYFSYRLPDYRGVVGIEGGFDKQLHGHAGEEDVLINNFGYRQTNNISDAPEPGENIVLTIDLDIQRAAQKSLADHQGADARGAIVVMDVRSGDVLAMVSSPAINPVYASNSPAYLEDTNLTPQMNRATQENYAPGSIFKPIVALAALENGLDPNTIVDNPGYVMVGLRRIMDEAPVGKYDLRRAIAYSCNTYFVTVGLRAGITNIIRMGEKFHFGERAGLPTRQETSGIFPALKQVEGSGWRDGNSANICIGQGQMDVTPLQMAVAYAAIANGGEVLRPRLVERIEPQDPTSGETATNFPSGLVRDHLGVSARNLKIVRAAMLAETEEGTGQAAQVAGLQICGKTGTAQVMNAQNREIGRTTWFASFAPYEHPHYAVVVMVEGGVNLWGHDCAPIAHDIYEEIVKKENSKKPGILAAMK